MTPSHPKSILLLSGLSGAGKTTALKTLEDMGWEVVDNLPLMLLDRLLDTPLPAPARSSRVRSRRTSRRAGPLEGARRKRS